MALFDEFYVNPPPPPKLEPFNPDNNDDEDNTFNTNMTNSNISSDSSSNSSNGSNNKNETFVYISSSATTDGPRNSIRLEGLRRFNRGLFVIDLRHMLGEEEVWRRDEEWRKYGGSLLAVLTMNICNCIFNNYLIYIGFNPNIICKSFFVYLPITVSLQQSLISIDILP